MEPRDPEQLTAVTAPVPCQIAAGTAMGAVHLTVADLDRSLAYYGSVLGLAVRERENGRVSLGTASRELLVLVEEPGARPAPGRTGLYHFALLVPERVDLARWLAHAVRTDTSLVGLSDHFVSEAIYLADPDRHGIEIYWDRPRAIWEGRVERRMTTLPLDVRSLLAELDDPQGQPFDALPEGTTMGHVHLKVASVADAIHFYRDVLGFGLMAALGPQAAFLSAGGYHHHVGANTWESSGGPPPLPGSAALRHATILLPTVDDRDAVAGRVADAGQEPERRAEGVLVRDPSGNALVLAAV